MLNVFGPTVRSLRRATAACLVLGLVGCGDPPVDSETPTPRGVVEGSMLYIGPRPLCTYVDGVAVEIQGRLLLTIADVNNLLPPEGTASQPADFLAIGGEDIFSLANCMPENPEPADFAQVIMQTANFRWPDLPLAVGPGATISYRISGFYDQEGDFNPLFAVRQTTTRGDMAGAALDNAQSPNPQFRLVTFGSSDDNPLGQKVTGVALTMGGFVQTEAPIFYVSDGDIAADAVFEAPQSLQFSMFSRDANDARRLELDTLLADLNMAGYVDFANPVAYAWYLERFDINRSGSNADEVHPITGGPYLSPYIFLQRVQNEIEVATRVPSVAIIPFVADTRHVRYPALDVGVAGVAAMIVNPASPLCRAIISPDGTTLGGGAVFMGDGSTASECHDLPTGYYGVNVLGGVVAGTVTPNGVGAAISETGADITGGQFGNQVWRLPNEFGDCRQLGGGPMCDQEGGLEPIASQGITGTVVVHDPTEAGPNGRRETNGQGGVCDGYTFAPFPMGANDLCCSAVAHLCDVPLCAYTDAPAAWSGSAFRVRGTPTSIVRGEDGVDRPNCMPFPIPTQCCPNEAPTE